MVISNTKATHIDYPRSSPGAKRIKNFKEPKREETQDEDGISVQFMDEVAVVPGSYSKTSEMKKTIPLERLREQHNQRNAST